MNLWESIEAHLAAREDDVTLDPWADTEVAADDEALTDAQAAFLAGLADQPAPPRIARAEQSGLSSDDDGPG
jgi:hypothetical protein